MSKIHLNACIVFLVEAKEAGVEAWIRPTGHWSSADLALLHHTNGIMARTGMLALG